MIQLNDVSKKLGSFLLNQISLSLPKGYIMGLAGVNGAGKTSLIRLILGVYPQDTGEIFIGGIEQGKNGKQAKDEIGFVLKEQIFPPHMKLLECGNLLGMHYSRYDSALFEAYLTEYNLSKEKKVGKMSEGEKMKFQFAFALSHDPKLLLIDEATGSFDPTFREYMQKKMTEFVSDGEHSILFASHVTDEMERIADYITFIHDGKIIFSMDKESLLDQYRVVKGPKYKMNLLRKEDVIWVEHTETGSTAFIENIPKHNEFDANVNAKRPTVEEVLYFMMKKESGGKTWEQAPLRRK